MIDIGWGERVGPSSPPPSRLPPDRLSLLPPSLRLAGSLAPSPTRAFCSDEVVFAQQWRTVFAEIEAKVLPDRAVVFPEGKGTKERSETLVNYRCQQH